MPTLSPYQAATIASGVYMLRTGPVSEALKKGGLGTEGLFAVGESSSFRGVSGALLWKQLSTFGYAAAGTGTFAREAVIATRGTAIGADWLTNLSIGVELGPGGLPVHAGFNRTWRSFAGELEAFLAQHKPTRVHCVGHSLGGALATLSADYLSARHVPVELYTFGCPRVGDGLFAAALTRRLGARNIHRVYHPSDPVPMIPLFPFWHAPVGEPGLGIAKGDAGMISVAAHGMADSYLPGVSEYGWGSLASAAGAGSELHVKSWLEQAAAGHGTFMMGSATLLTMIGRALGWILAKAGKLVLNGLGFAATVGLTVVDLVAAMLSRAAELSKQLAGHVKTVVWAIFRFLGRPLAAGADVTLAFLRWVLELLFGTLARAAHRAVSLIR